MLPACLVCSCSRFLMQTKDMVVERGWTYSSTLYLAILYECIAREDYAMANMIVEVYTSDQ